MQPVSKNKRLINFIIDSITIGLLTSGISFFSSGKILTVITTVLFFLYYLTLEYNYNGQTIGKKFSNTKVVNLKGGNPSFKAIFIRSILRFNPFYVFSFLFGNEIGTHDIFSKTRVVEATS